MSGDMYVKIDGIDECLKAFNGLSKEIRKNANGELRKASKEIAAGIIPMLGGSGSPQEAAFISAAAPKSDRYVVVAVPGRKPRLSGLKKTSAAVSKRLVWAIEGGSGYKAFHGPAAGSMVAKHRDKIARAAIPQYTRSLYLISKKYGLL